MPIWHKDESTWHEESVAVEVQAENSLESERWVK